MKQVSDEWQETFICQCSSIQHQVRFYIYDEDELGVQAHLVTHRNFFKSLWVGLRYAFGYRSRFGEWDDMLMGVKDQETLYRVLHTMKRARENEQGDNSE